MKVLSLCDGMSCGHIALDRAGIKVDEYFAAEIKEIAIKVTKDNYPDTIHIGDVTKVSYKDGILYTVSGNFNVGHIDLVIFGSPCQTFSVAMKKELRVGLEDKQKSGLFLECHRILKEVNPTWFLMENVGTMKDEDKDVITRLLGVEPLAINSSLVSAQLRRRYYWTNIPGITMPIKKNIKLKDIITSGYVEKEKARALVVSESRPLKDKQKMIHRYRTTGMLTLVFENLDDKENTCRIFNQIELERLQTVPEGYTKCLTRNEAADVLGDGWTVDVIAHIFSFIPEEKRQMPETTDLSDAPEEIKAEIIKNTELLNERDGEEITEEQNMETNNREPATIENIISFNAIEQLKRLADERKALANLKPENTRFSDDVRAIEYAIGVMEAVGL